VGGHLGDVLALEDDAAPVDREKARDAVEQRRLAGAVLADEPEDLALPQHEVDLVDGRDATEPLDDLPALENHGGIGPGGDPLGLVRRSHGLPGFLCRLLRLAVAGDRGARRCAGDEHRAQDVRSVEKLLGRSGETELALLHEHRPLGELKGDVYRLLDDDDRQAGLVDLPYHVDQLTDDRRSEAE
jgi:hypothetical protein